MAHDYAKLREQVLAEYATDRWQKPGVERATLVKLSEPMADYIIGCIKLMDGSLGEDATPIFGGIAMSMATIIVNLTDVMEDPEMAALELSELINSYIVSAFNGGAKITDMSIPQKVD